MSSILSCHLFLMHNQEHMEILTKILKFIAFVLLTILVVPAMLIMVWAHPTWEKFLNEF